MHNAQNMKKYITFFLLIIIWLFPLEGLWAQPAFNEALPKVKEVALEHEGVQVLSDQAVYSDITVFPGQELDPDKVNASIRALYETGLYKAINVKIDEIAHSEVILTFHIESKPKIAEIKFFGNQKMSNARLFNEIESKAGELMDEAQLNQDVQKLKAFYQGKGHFDAKIDYTVNENKRIGKASITFKIDEGLKITISKIKFIGHEPVHSGKLVSIMNTKESGVLSILTGHCKFKEDIFYEDLQHLRDYFRDQGYLDVEILESEVQFEYPSPSRMVICIHIDKGKLYKVGNVTVSGNTLFQDEKLKALLQVKAGDIFAPGAIDRDRNELMDAYGEFGYLETYVIAERKANLETGAIDIKYDIQESEKFYVETINVVGNSKSKSTVILRELALAPGDVFDLKRMKNSQLRLENTRFFEDVILTPDSSNIPGRKNLNILVKEGKTGNLNFGISFSLVQQFVGSIELSQSNFDFKNYRSLFQGAGQKFKFSFQVDRKSHSMLLEFEEPWVCERELAFGFQVYQTESRYVSKQYNEARIGGEAYLRKRLYDLFQGTLAYSLEEVNIKDVHPSASQFIKSMQGRRTTSKGSFKLARDTRDNLTFPNRGSRFDMAVELVGGPFDGDTHYALFNVGVGKWFPTFEFGHQNLLLSAHAGTIMPYGNRGDVPIFDRYFLGGPNTMRGFDYKDVGPKDANNEPIGGNTMMYGIAEYSFKIMEPLMFAAFYDIGFVAPGDFDFDFSRYNHDLGVGLRLFILGAPLRLDLGFPIKGDGINNKETWRFHYSFGTVF